MFANKYISILKKKIHNFFQHPADSEQVVAEEIDMAWLVVNFMNSDHSPGTTVRL